MNREELVKRAINEAFYYDRPDGVPYHPKRYEHEDIGDMMLMDGIEIPPGFEIVSSGEMLQATFDHEAIERAKEVYEKSKTEFRLWHNWTNAADAMQTLLDSYRRSQAGLADNAMTFRNKVTEHLNAVSLMIRASMMATSHGEKDARLRGVIDVIESAIRELNDIRKYHFHFDWFPNSVLSSDRHEHKLQRKVWELESYIEKYQNQFGHLPLNGEKPEDEEIAF